MQSHDILAAKLAAKIKHALSEHCNDVSVVSIGTVVMATASACSDYIPGDVEIQVKVLPRRAKP